MGLKRTLLKPIARLAGRHATRQLREFLRAHDRTAEVQDALLRRLLDLHAETAFGRDHGFATIRSYEDFVSAVPIRDYDAFAPYLRRVLDGEAEALLPPGERPVMFSMTSGTTGEPKFIPVTPRFARDMQRGFNMFGMRVLTDHPAAWLRPILQIASPMREADSPTGLPCGAVSGLLAETQKRIVRRMYVVPPFVRYIKDPAAKYYTTLRCGVGRDVSIIVTANPSSTIKMIETGRAHAERLVRDVAEGALTPPGGVDASVARRLRFRPDRRLAERIERGVAADGALLPKHFWNVGFLCNWTGGTLKLYLPRLRELFPGVAIRDVGLLASEGRFSLPLRDETPAGVAEITGNFLEFIPADQRESDDPDVLRAHELERGGEYFLVFSNLSGLWRYNLDDRVRVAEFHGQTPVIEFLSRGVSTASITGEKITEHQVVEAMRRAGRRCDATVDRFVVQGRFAATPYYEVRFEAGPADPAALAAAMDEQLCELNVEYAGKRTSERLGRMRAVVLPAGTMERAEAERVRRTGRSEQYKHQYLRTDVATSEE